MVRKYNLDINFRKINMKIFNIFFALALITPLAINTMQSIDDEDYEWDFVLPTVDAKNGKGKTIDRLHFTKHALDRMQQRQVSEKDACWVATHGNRHATDKTKATKLCVDTKKRIGVVLDDSTNVVITVYNNMSKEKRDRRLEKIKNKKNAPAAPAQTKPPLRSSAIDMAEFDAFKL